MQGPAKPRKNTEILDAQAEWANFSPNQRGDRQSFFRFFYSEPAVTMPQPGLTMRSEPAMMQQQQVPYDMYTIPISPSGSNTLVRKKKKGNEGKMIYASQERQPFPKSTCISVPFAQMDTDGSEIHWRFIVILEMSDGTTISTKHRYSEFYELHKQWTSKHPTLQSTGIEFPKRMVTVTDADIAQRAMDLEIYLRQICTINAVIPFVATFLKCDKSTLSAALDESARSESSLSSDGPEIIGGSYGYDYPMPTQQRFVENNTMMHQPGPTMMYNSNPFNGGFNTQQQFPGNSEMYPMIGGSESYFASEPAQTMFSQQSQQQGYYPPQRRMTWFTSPFTTMWGNQYAINYSQQQPQMMPQEQPKPYKMSLTMPSMRGLRMPTFSFMPGRSPKEAPPLPPRPTKKRNILARKPSMAKPSFPIRSFRPTRKQPGSSPPPSTANNKTINTNTPPVNQPAFKKQPKANNGTSNTVNKGNGKKGGSKNVDVPPPRPSAVGVDVKNRVKMIDRKKN